MTINLDRIKQEINHGNLTVLVPFYRGAVVFYGIADISPLASKFSSPFIEERLYLENFKNVFVVSFSALLSWSNIDQNNGLD